MSQAAQFNGDIYVAGNMASATMTYPNGSILDAAVNASAAIASTKHIDRQFGYTLLFGTTTTVTALTQGAQRFNAPATLIAISAQTWVIASGADRTIDVDLQKSSAGGAFATVLTATIHFTNASTALIPLTGTFSSTGLVSGDTLKFVISVAGAAGAQAQGLDVLLVVDRSPQ